MLVRVYWTIWGIFAFTGLVLFATGNLTMLTAVIFGFIAFGLTFLGMMNVLPLMVAHPEPAKPVATEQVAIQPMKETPAKAFGILKSA